MSRILLPLLLLLLLTGCARDPDPQASLEELRNRAELLARAGQRAEAAAVLHRAIRLQPYNTALYLRQGEFFEASGAARQAAGVYESARKAVPAEHPDQPELAYRLALLYALPLGRPEAARQLLHHLPPDSPQHHDLLGLLACTNGDGRAALEAFNTALRQPLPSDLAARILFHAALAYQLLGDERNTYGSLYRAVGLTEHLGLMYEMRVFMDEFGRPPDHGQP
jgi:tetratricopeptide (TPR) repeat protein